MSLYPSGNFTVSGIMAITNIVGEFWSTAKPIYFVYPASAIDAFHDESSSKGTVYNLRSFKLAPSFACLNCMCHSNASLTLVFSFSKKSIFKNCLSQG